MSLLAKALLTVTMFQPAGNATTGSESVVITESMVECRQAMRLFQASKGTKKDTINTKDGVSFTSPQDSWYVSDIKYKLTCTSFEEVQ